MTIQEWLGSDNQLGIDIWEKKYCRNGESFEEWLDRVSGGNQDVRQLIKEKKFLFGGRILSNRGAYKDGEKVTYSNCYVITPPEDNIESIFDCAKKLARTFSYGGGCGIDIGKLSPRGAKVNNTAKETSGSVSFMDLYSLTTGLIGQNGRRGALMISIPCDHPDIEEFIECKSDLSRVTKANISIRISDDFMKAVENDEDWYMSFVREETGENVYKKVKAKDLYRKFCEMNWDYAEPGMLFWDRIKGWNLLSEDDEFEYAGTNPCFTGDMELLTSEGYKKFSELDGTKPIIYSVNGNPVQSKVWCSGEKETVTVKLGKQDIVCTPNHIFMTFSGDECMAKDLKGKYLMPPTSFNKTFDEEFIKYGFIQGDGQLTRLKDDRFSGIEVNIGYKDGDIKDLFTNEDFTEKSHREIYLLNYKDKLKNLGFSNESLPNRVFPTTYKTWTHLQKASFLHGCYSANGSVIKNGRVAYKTTCKKFAEQLKETLESDFGINGVYITTNKPTEVEFENGVFECKESYDVNIGRYKELTKFMSEINFYQYYKREQLTQMIKKRSPYVYNVIPNGIQKVYDFTEPERHWGIVEGVVVHNCAEEPLPAGGSCLLGSLNLSEFVDENKQFDTDSFIKAIDIAVTALNEVLDEGLTLHPLQEQRDSVKNWRQIGLGIMGLADMLIKMGIRYGSKESIQICTIIGSFLSLNAIITSEKLGKNFGSYPKFKHEVNKSKYFKYNTDANGWFEVNNLRNSQLLTIAPTGTLSTMLGISGGIEPIFANYYTRKTESLHGHDEYYKVYTPIVKKYMEEHGLSDDSELPDYFVTAHELDYKQRIDMQSVWQKHIDASISSTINVPNDFTIEQVEDLYMYAWQKGLKGVTIYRDGCKRSGILTTNDDDKEEEKSDDTLKRGMIIRANDNCIGKKRTLQTGCGSLHCTAFFDPDTGDLLETYFSKGSSGGCQNFMVGLSRMISLAARGGIDVFSIVDQLKSSGTCPSYAVRTATKHDTSKGSCCPVAIGNALIDMYKETMSEISDEEIQDVDTIHHQKKSIDKPQSTMRCPECGGTLVFEGGCNTCKDCGWSKCE